MRWECLPGWCPPATPDVAKLAIVTSSPPDTEGGHLMLANWLAVCGERVGQRGIGGRMMPKLAAVRAETIALMSTSP